MVQHKMENVYNIVRPATPEEVRPPRYESQNAKTIRAEFREGRGRLPHRTMGEAETEKPEPDNFLRKKTREVKFRQRAKSARRHSELIT